MMIVDRVTMEADLDLFGYSPDKVLMATHWNSFVTICLFETSANEVFFATIEERRRQEHNLRSSFAPS
jgi:hypothetical protein